MNAHPGLLRASRFAWILLATGLGATPAAATTATIIDSFTDPLPANPRLPVSGRRVLFLASLCDGAACPPGTVAPTPQCLGDTAGQTSRPGTIGSVRETGLATTFEPLPDANGVLTIEGGSLSLLAPSGPALAFWLRYGDWDQPLDLDLGVDGSDRLEIEFLSASTTPSQPFRVTVTLFPSLEDNYPSASYAGTMAGPGVFAIPYGLMDGDLEEFHDDVDLIEVSVATWFPGSLELAIGELRTAATPIPTRTESWGRIKDAYRR